MPIGTRAHSSIGGHWERVASGWRAQSGSVFPTPGADVSHVSFPPIEGMAIPATREPGDPVRAEAIELLACIASQRDLDWFTTYATPGKWSRAARRRATAAWDSLDDAGRWLDWREMYAEAEARLREQVRHAG